MKHWKSIMIVVISLLYLGCEADSGDLEECDEVDTGTCAKLVSCCDLILSEDIDGQSIAGASCLNDQLVAINSRGGGEAEEAVCEELLAKPEYADVCFVCENEATRSEDAISSSGNTDGEE